MILCRTLVEEDTVALGTTHIAVDITMVSPRISVLFIANDVCPVDYSYSGRSGSTSGGFSDDTGRRPTFEAYDAGDDEVGVQRSGSLRASGSASRPSASAGSASRTKAEAPPPSTKSAAKVVDLLGFDDEDAFGSSSASKPTEKALPAVTANPLDGTSKYCSAMVFVDLPRT